MAVMTDIHRIGKGISVPIPKFVSLCGPQFTNFGIESTLATYRFRVALVQKSARRMRGDNDRDFRTATLERQLPGFTDQALAETAVRLGCDKHKACVLINP